MLVPYFSSLQVAKKCSGLQISDTNILMGYIQQGYLMWIKLVKHIGEDSLWFSLPSDNNELKLVEGDLIRCRQTDGQIEKLPIVFRYVPWIRTIDSIPYHIQLKTPCVNSTRSIIDLDEIEVDDNELSKYKNIE